MGRMARVTHVKKARKANKEAGIKKGDSYYWWKFRFGGKRFSLTPPRRSQLTQSNFYSQLYDAEDAIGDLEAGAFSDVSSLQSEIDSIKDNLESLKSECEDSLSNMPDSLQSAPTGELLQERIDELDNLISELDSIDYSEPEEATKEDKLPKESLEDAQDRLLLERCQEVIDEAQAANWSIS